MKYFLSILVAVLLIASSAQAKPLKIMLTNDDGFLAPGIQALRAALIKAGHDVYMIAPESNQSGSGTSISAQGITFKVHDHQVWSVAGTPGDAVRFGLGEILKNNPPDLVVSGMNFGQNAGLDAMISGTVGAAVTAVQMGFPAIASSAAIDLTEAQAGFPSTLKTFTWASTFLASIVDDERLRLKGQFLNINFPTGIEPKGIRPGVLAPTSILSNNFTQSETGLWRSGYSTVDSQANTDRALLQAGFISVTLLGPSYEITGPDDTISWVTTLSPNLKLQTQDE